MPSTHYFEKFPFISYNGYNAVDIVSNAKLVERFINNPYVYYPYELSNDQRADVLAHQYYDDSYYSWLIYYGNKIVDPYHDWCLPEDDFLRHIAVKYGSIEYAQKKVMFYRTNWANDYRQLTPSMFDNTIGSHEKKYWDRKFNEEIGVLLYYYRKQEDIMANTNKIITYAVSHVGTLKVGDLVDIRRNSVNIGTAEVLDVGTDFVTVKNIYYTQGNLVAGDVIRKDGDTTVYSTISSTRRTVVNIPDSEMAYWEAVSYFDYENEMNTLKKTVKLIDNKLAYNVSEALVDAMRD